MLYGGEREAVACDYQVIPQPGVGLLGFKDFDLADVCISSILVIG